MSPSQSNVSHLNRDPRIAPGTQRFEAHATARPSFDTPRKAPFVAKGHDAQLMEAQQNRLPTQLTLMSGVSFGGIITRRDKFTVTLRHDEVDGSAQRSGMDEIFYKHAIESVLIDRSSLAAAQR